MCPKAGSREGGHRVFRVEKGVRLEGERTACWQPCGQEAEMKAVCGEMGWLWRSPRLEQETRKPEC